MPCSAEADSDVVRVARSEVTECTAFTEGWPRARRSYSVHFTGLDPELRWLSQFTLHELFILIAQYCGKPTCSQGGRA